MTTDTHRCGTDGERGACDCADAYRVDCLGVGETRFASNALRFATEDDAVAYARDLYSRWTGLKAWRIVTADTPQRESADGVEVRTS